MLGRNSVGDAKGGQGWLSTTLFIQQRRRQLSPETRGDKGPRSLLSGSNVFRYTLMWNVVIVATLQSAARPPPLSLFSARQLECKDIFRFQDQNPSSQMLAGIKYLVSAASSVVDWHFLWEIWRLKKLFFLPYNSTLQITYCVIILLLHNIP